MKLNSSRSLILSTIVRFVFYDYRLVYSNIFLWSVMPMRFVSSGMTKLFWKILSVVRRMVFSRIHLLSSDFSNLLGSSVGSASIFYAVTEIEICISACPALPTLINQNRTWRARTYFSVWSSSIQQWSNKKFHSQRSMTHVSSIASVFMTEVRLIACFSFGIIVHYKIVSRLDATIQQ